MKIRYSDQISTNVNAFKPNFGGQGIEICYSWTDVSHCIGIVILEYPT